MSRFVDLDAIVVPELEVKLKGTLYRLPGSPEVERMLRWLSFQERFKDATAEESVELLQEIYDDLLEVFQEFQPDLKKLPINQEQVMPLFEALFDASVGEGEAPPPTPRTRQRSKKS